MTYWAVALFVVVAACEPPKRPELPHPASPARRTNVQVTISSLLMENGLHVVLVRDPRASELHVTMRYQVGAVDDPVGQEGIAHLVEHLMFQQVIGTESIFTKLETQAREFNAATKYDSTTYTTRAPVERLDALLAIETARLNARCASITEAVFTREREVVINEIRMRNYAQELYTAMNRGAYPANHPYTRLSGGVPEALGRITMAQACAFADAHYAPGNAVLVISGNVEPAAVEAALSRSLEHLKQRTVAPVPRIPVPTERRNVEVNAPIDDDAVLVAWALPEDPAKRVRLRAVFAGTAAYIDSLVKGRVFAVELGDEGAPMLGVVIARKDEEAVTDILKSVQKATGETGKMFRQDDILTQLYFDRFRQLALYNAFAGLEDGSDRDEHLAAHVAAGRPPDRALADELASLRTLTNDIAGALADEYFTYERANIVVMKASESTRGATKLSVAVPIHDIGQRREPPDPMLAKEPAAEPLAVHPPEGMVSRRLGNGVKVILAPMTSVPTVDVRVVFEAGSADDPAGRSGTALLAGKGLEWKPRHLEEAIGLTTSGVDVSVDVGLDRTVFFARGLDMNIDYLLLALRRVTRDGKYRHGASAVADSLRKAAKDVDDEGALTDAWRVALYGDTHPYTTGGIPRHVSSALRVADAIAFRKTRFTPDNATVIVSGGFDPVVANNWIDSLFSDWDGIAAERGSVPTTAKPVSLAKDGDLAQVKLAIALPAPGGTRAERMIAAAMLAGIASDVRHQLGAAYVFDASYEQLRQSSNYVLVGAVDAPRTHEAVALIKDRIAQLHTDKDAAARAFVLARRHVLATLTATTGSAETISDRITQDVTLRRPPLSDVALAQEVHEITISAMSVALTDLDLSRAAILMHGPPADVDKAFAVLGRTATRLTTEIDTRDDPTAKVTEDEKVEEQLDEPDEPELRITLSFALTAGLVGGTFAGTEVSGSHICATVGYRLDETKSVGGRVSIASVDGTHYDMFTAAPQHLVALPVAIGIYFQASLFDRVHGSVFASFDLNRVNPVADDPAYVPLWRTGLSAGLELGVDLLRYKRHRLTVYGRIEEEVGSVTDFDAKSYGIGYRLF